MRLVPLSFACFIALGFADIAAGDCTKKVHFARGATFATYSGHISGYEYCDYVFTAAAGQTLTVNVTGKHTNVITPVLFDPEQQIDIWKPITLDRAGRHTVRIIMPRTFARQSRSVSYKVRIAIE